MLISYRRPLSKRVDVLGGIRISIRCSLVGCRRAPRRDLGCGDTSFKGGRTDLADRRRALAGWRRVHRSSIPGACEEHDSNCTPPPITTVQDPRQPPAYTADEHIDHAVKTVGVDHLGLGSAFDGATMPLGSKDASKPTEDHRRVAEEGLL